MHATTKNLELLAEGGTVAGAIEQARQRKRKEGFEDLDAQLAIENALQQRRRTGIQEENVQARVRGTTLMGISNQEGHLVLATGNKSELAVGYSTMYGDAVGGFAPIKDIYKTQVWELARWRNELAVYFDQTPPIPVNSIDKEPSAELRPDQTDQDSLPPYDVLDSIIQRYMESNLSGDQLSIGGIDDTTIQRVVRLIQVNEYKRRQAAVGVRVTPRAWGRDWRYPITSGWR